MPNIPPTMVETKVKINIKATIGMNIRLMITAMVETLEKAYRQIGKANICAVTTSPTEFAIFVGKNFKHFANGFAKTIMPNTTINESSKPTQKSCTGENNKIKIPAKESAVKLSYLCPFRLANSITEVITVALSEDDEKPHIPL